MAALTGHLTRVLTDDALATRLSEAAPGFVAAEHDVHRCTARLERLYDRVAGSGRVSGAGTVAVVIPTFNAEGFVARAIASARAQTLPASEIILVDDCSTDGTRAVLEGIGREDPRVRIVDMPRNGGPSAARNAGIRSGDERLDRHPRRRRRVRAGADWRP